MKIPLLDSKSSYETRWKPASHLTWKIQKDEVVVVDSQEGKVYHFNGVGAAVWKALNQNLNAREIATILAVDFEASENKILKDVARFLKELKSQDLIDASENA